MVKKIIKILLICLISLVCIDYVKSKPKQREQLREKDTFGI